MYAKIAVQEAWKRLRIVRFRLAALTTCTITLILVIGLFTPSLLPLSGTDQSRPSNLTQAPSASTTNVFITPPNITGTPINGRVTFSVGINQTATLSGFFVELLYDTKVVDALSVDYSSGILAGSSPFVLINCIDAIPQGGANCPSASTTDIDGPNQVSLQVVLPNSLSNVAGTLFSINFVVTGTGLSGLTFYRALLSVGPILLPSISTDGFFSNKTCGSQICAPLSVRLAHSALSTLVAGRTAQFNATVTDPNKAALDTFTWNWGDGLLFSYTKNPNATHVFLNPAQSLVVTVTVNDTYGVNGVGSLGITVGRIWAQLSVNRFTLDPPVPVSPGALVAVAVQVSNLGTTNVTTNLNVVLDNGEAGNKTLINQSFFLAPSASASAQKYTIDTSNYLPNVYRIDASLQLQGSNSTLYLNDTRTSVGTLFLVLVQPLPSNAGLTLLQAGGLGLGGIVTAYVVFVAFRRVFRAKPEL